MNKNCRLVELKPNPLLIDSLFEGYKLSLDPIPTYFEALNSGVFVVHPNENQFSFLHVKTFSLHNHLHVNKFKPNDIYFIDKHYKIQKITFVNHRICLEEVFKIENVCVPKAGCYNMTIIFPAPDMSILCDGAGTTYLIKITTVQGKETWEILGNNYLLKEDISYLLRDACFEVINDNKLLHLILTEIKEKDAIESVKDKQSKFSNVIKWKVFYQNDINSWKEKNLKVFEVDGNVDYIALGPECKSVYIVSNKYPKWIFDSEKSVIEDNNSDECSIANKIYTWTQTTEEINVSVKLPSDVTKSNIKVVIDELKLEIKVNNDSFLCGQFCHKIDEKLSSWCFEKNELEIQLYKFETGLMWKSLLLDNEEGEEILNPEFVAGVHEKLAHLCSDREEDFQISYCAQHLEECDAASGESTVLLRLEAENCAITHEVNLSSSEWLFKINCNAFQTPAICCRHDYDACVWQFKEDGKNDNNWAYEHLGTFSAFGYVQASKIEKKFLTSPPNLSYAVICESSSHIYIYRQPTPLNTELKNRHTGKKISKISRQHLVNLSNNRQILGVYATDNVLYILLEDSVAALIVNAL